MPNYWLDFSECNSSVTRVPKQTMILFSFLIQPSSSVLGGFPRFTKLNTKLKYFHFEANLWCCWSPGPGKWRKMMLEVFIFSAWCLLIYSLHTESYRQIFTPGSPALPSPQVKMRASSNWREDFKELTNSDCLKLTRSLVLQGRRPEQILTIDLFSAKCRTVSGGSDDGPPRDVGWLVLACFLIYLMMSGCGRAGKITPGPVQWPWQTPPPPFIW